MKKICLCLGVLIITLASVYSQDVTFSGELGTMWGVTAPGTENPGDFTVGKTDFTGEIEAFMGDSSAFVEGTISYNCPSNELSFDLGEAYIDYSSAIWGIRLGQQKAVWGKADGINITNSVFPEDSSDIFTDDSALPVTAARLSVTGSFFTVDGYVIPFFKGNKLPLEESNPLRKVMIPESVTMEMMETSIELPVLIGSLNAPEISLENMEYGLKASGYFPFCDVSVYGFYGWDKTPLLSYSVNTVTHPVYGIEIPESLTINGEYKRLGMIGIDAAKPVGATVLRLESAFFPERYVQASDTAIMNGEENYVQQNQLVALGGIDWMPEGWTLTAQYYCDVLLNKSDNTKRGKAFEQGATLSVSKTLLNDTLELSLSGMINFQDFDSVINFTTEYSLSDQIKLSGGAYVFLPGPENDGTYGKLKDLSTVYIKGVYSF